MFRGESFLFRILVAPASIAAMRLEKEERDSLKYSVLLFSDSF